MFSALLICRTEREVVGSEIMQLINICIGFLLSTLVMMGVIHWYQISHKVYEKQKIAAEHLNNINTTLQFLKRDIQGAGYRGCRSQDPTFPIYRIYNQNNPHYRFFRFDRAAFAFKASPGACYGKMPESACQRVRENSIVLILYNIPQKFNYLKEAMKSAEEDIIVDSKVELWNNSLALISDCSQGDVFIATEVLGNKILHENIAKVNISRSLSKAYDTTAEIVELQTIAYYIGSIEHPEKRKNLKHLNSRNKMESEPIYALFRDDFIHHSDELIPNIDEMGIEIGLTDKTMDKPTDKTSDKTKDKNRVDLNYKLPDNIEEGEWGKARTIRITFIDDHNRRWTHEIALRNGNGFDLSHSDIVGNILPCFATFAKYVFLNQSGSLFSKA